MKVLELVSTIHMNGSVPLINRLNEFINENMQTRPSSLVSSIHGEIFEKVRIFIRET